jgi:hypothetical protein
VPIAAPAPPRASTSCPSPRSSKRSPPTACGRDRRPGLVSARRGRCRASRPSHAVTVTHVLVDLAGIRAKKLVAVGFGEYAPIADNKDNAGRARNRRMEIILLPDVDVLTSEAERKPG